MGMTRATGMNPGFRNLRYPAPGRPALIAVVVVSSGAIATGHVLIDRGPPGARSPSRLPRSRRR